MNTVLDVKRLRRDFPAFVSDSVARFDGPGGTQVPSPVIEAMVHHLSNSNANAHWHFPASERTDLMIADARATFASFVGGAAEEIVFGANMTTLSYHLSRGLARGWVAGDEVIVTELDHHANIAPWRAIAQERGIMLRWLPLDPGTGQLCLDSLPGLITDRTRLLAITAASNALGTIVDVTAAAKVAHDAGAMVFVDAVHYAPHRLLDVAAMDADFVVCSPYKFYGPHLGVLWGKKALLDSVQVAALQPQPQTVPERLESGTKSFESIAGAAAAVKWIASLGGKGGVLRDELQSAYDALHEHEARLFTVLWEGLGSIKGICRFGPAAGMTRTGTVSVTCDTLNPDAMAKQLSEVGCWASSGHFYAQITAERCGVMPEGWLRLGLAAYSEPSDVERVLSALEAMVA